jgi:hypothetical protein
LYNESKGQENRWNWALAVKVYLFFNYAVVFSSVDFRFRFQQLSTSTLMGDFIINRQCAPNFLDSLSLFELVREMEM